MSKNSLPNRTCKICGGEFPAEEFAVGKGRVRYRSHCRPCWKPIQSGLDARPENRYSRGRAQARSRKIPWEITLDEFKEIIAQPCCFCGGPLEPTGVGMDRVEHKAGYVPGNVNPCCCICNTIRSRVFTVPEMRLIGEAIKVIRENRAERGIPQPITAAYYYRLRKDEVRQ